MALPTDCLKLVVLLTVPACSDIPECPEQTVTVASYDGPAVTRTWIDCEGDRYFSSLCGRGLNSSSWASSPCGLAIHLEPGFAGVPSLGFKLTADRSLAGARIDLRSDEDGEGSIYDARSGWLELTEDPMGRFVGAFELELPDTIMRGTFDTSYDPSDDP